MNDPNNSYTMCMCKKCKNVFPYKNRKKVEWNAFGVCPKCEGSLIIVDFKNHADDNYLNFLGIKYSV